MFKYLGKENDLFKVEDTDDGVVDKVDGDSLRQAMNQVKIEGLYFDDNGNICEDVFDEILVENKVKTKTKNSNLTKAKKAKNDEFYTQLSDIEKELSHYPIETFKDKVIYCPMDVAVNTGAILQSQFVKYFQLNAHKLQFKKLICTCLVEKAQGVGEDIENVQNCYVLERVKVPTMQRNIYGYSHGQGSNDTVIDEIDDFGIKYKRQSGGVHAVPYHIINQAVTDATGKIELIGKYVNGFDPVTGQPTLVDDFMGNYWYFEGHRLSIKWCRKHPDGTLEVLPNECYFFNNDDIISDFSVFPEGTLNGEKVTCYESVDGGSVCLYPSEYYDYKEVDYSDNFVSYFSHCPEDDSEFGGSGDFRSKYCTNLLAEADIVVTNPPFSLFREFLAWVVSSNKKFITLADQNCITYKEVFPLLKNNKMWVGTQTGITSMMFEVPDSYPVPDYAVEWCKKHTTKDYFDNHRLTYLSGISWFTNVEINKRHDKLIGLSMQDLIDKGVKFPKYDNYNAIDVSKVKEIPMDYDGVMGVPITFLYQYCPEQFEIVNANDYRLGDTPEKSTMLIKDKEATITDNTGHTHTSYARICIRKKTS